MKERLLLLLIISFSFIVSGCQIVPTDKPYIVDVKLSPTDYLDVTTTSTKIVYTIKNPLKIAFNGKVLTEFEDNCISMQKEQEVMVKTESKNSGTITINRYKINEECDPEQQIVLRLSGIDKLPIYDSKQLKLKLIK